MSSKVNQSVAIMIQSTAEDTTVVDIKLPSIHFNNQSTYKSLSSQFTLTLLISSKVLWFNHYITIVTEHYVTITILHRHIYIGYNTTAYCKKPLLIICNFISALWKVHLCQIIVTVHLHHPSSLCIYITEIWFHITCTSCHRCRHHHISSSY